MSTFRVNKNVNYLRTTILNAPTTIEHYYQAQGNWLTAQNRKK